MSGTPPLVLNQSAKASTVVPSGNKQANNYHILPISPEFVNWLLSLVIYSLRYPAVFWYTRKVFSMVFAFLLFAASFQYMLAYCAIGILYKYQVNDTMYSQLQLVLPFEALIILYLLTNTFVFMSSISIFSYGYYHYDESYRKFISQHQYHRSRRKLLPAVGCEGYVPHSVATITLMLFVASRATVVYDVVTLYRNTNNKVLLASVVWDVAYMLIWIITWFIFTIKQSWGFRVWSSVLSTDCTSDVYTIRNDHACDSTLMQQQQCPDSNLEQAPSSANASASAVAMASQDVIIRNGAAGPGHLEPDVVDSAPGSPGTSAMRRRSSGDRRPGGNVRVTFEEDDIDPDDLSRRSPRRRSKESKDSASRRRKQQRRAEHPDVEAERGLRSTHDERPKNVFGNFPLQETPENTLTRSYRHSIRDKCGQYYRHSREFQSPPAAQSSPVLGQRSSDQSELSASRDSSVTREIPSREIPTRELPPRDLSSRDIPPRDLPPRDLPHRELPPRDPLPPREPLPQRRSGSREPERPPRPARNISPARSQPQPQAAAAPPSLSKSHLPPKPPIGGERVLPPLPAHTHNLNHVKTVQPKPQSQHPSSDIQYNMRTNHDQRAGSTSPKSYPSGMLRNNLSGKPPIGGSTRLAADRHAHVQPNRDIRVLGANAMHSKKPEMGRRDSALPSSNETSSNDSSDNVLCSQV